MAAAQMLDALDVMDLSLDEALKMLPPIFARGIGYSERVCLERWVSGAEPVFVYGRNGKLRGLALAGGDGALVVHAPPTDRFYLDYGTGYPPDWNFYKGSRSPSPSRDNEQSKQET